MAERVVNAIRENRFYILSEAGGTWRRACEARLENIRQGARDGLAEGEDHRRHGCQP